MWESWSEKFRLWSEDNTRADRRVHQGRTSRSTPDVELAIAEEDGDQRPEAKLTDQATNHCVDTNKHVMDSRASIFKGRRVPCVRAMSAPWARRTAAEGRRLRHMQRSETARATT